MDLNEIEEEYKKSLEISEKKFIDDIKIGLNIKNIELEYKKATAKARNTYNLKLSDFLKKNTNLSIKKANKEEKDKVFKVNTDSYELNFFERLNRKLIFFIFKVTFHLKNSFKKLTPSYVLYIYYRLKIKIVRFAETIVDPVKSLIGYFSELFLKIKLKFKEITHTKS